MENKFLKEEVTESAIFNIIRNPFLCCYCWSRIHLPTTSLQHYKMSDMIFEKAGMNSNKSEA
jgi:hypothetical protein